MKSEPRVEIPATCEIHGGPRRVVVWREGDRVMLDGHADGCCVLTMPGAALTRLFAALGEALPVRVNLRDEDTVLTSRALIGHDLVAGYDRRHPVIRGLTLEVRAGETLALSGPSGSGKSTLARVLSLLHPPFAGAVWLNGTQVSGCRYRAPRELRTRIGVVFQQPRLSVDPRMTLRRAIGEPLAAARAPDAPARIEHLVELVGLTADLLGRRPHEVSDGQLQRACLARALALDPDYLICDEVTTMLDASTAAALVAVIRDYQQRSAVGVLAISHDTVLLNRWADRAVTLF